MKKIFFTFFITLTLFAYVNNVNAETLDYSYGFPFSCGTGVDCDFDITESQLIQIIEDSKNEFITYWAENYMDSYPYYLIRMSDIYSSSEIRLELIFSNSVNNFSDLFYGLTPSIITPNRGIMVKTIYSSDGTPSYPEMSVSLPNSPARIYEMPYFYNVQPGSVVIDRVFNSLAYYQSNFDYYYTGSDTLRVVKNNEIILTLNPNDIVPSYYNFAEIPSTYIEVNLNNYDSIILSLKNYNERPKFNTTIYTLGQLCLTPVYNYGMKPKTDYYSGYTIDGCSPEYFEFTPVKVSILEQDILNHSVYYIKAYNYAIENKVKIDTSIFDITYITSENANNPTVEIGGRSYPVIPYTDLTSSATISTNEGYISGASCGLGDFNCQAEYSGLDISDLFSNPLKLLQSIWTSIITVLHIIQVFILILPPTLQGFLYLSFMLAIVLGVIKIIIG